MVFSELVREEAIEVLLCCADWRITHHGGATDDIAAGIVDDVASEAWLAAFSVVGGAEIITPGGPGGGSVTYLEAAALLRDGWCPGDPVVRL